MINTASVVALVGSATPQLAYTASKGAVLAMTRELAMVHAREGIRFNALCPAPLKYACNPVLKFYFLRVGVWHIRALTGVPRTQHSPPTRLARRRRSQAPPPRDPFPNRTLRRSHRTSPRRPLPRQRREQLRKWDGLRCRWRHDKGPFFPLLLLLLPPLLLLHPLHAGPTSSAFLHTRNDLGGSKRCGIDSSNSFATALGVCPLLIKLTYRPTSRPKAHQRPRRLISRDEWGWQVGIAVLLLLVLG